MATPRRGDYLYFDNPVFSRTNRVRAGSWHPAGGLIQSTPTMTDHAVLVNLDGTSLPSWVYEQNDLWTLEEQLIEVLERDGIGELDGNEVGPIGYKPSIGLLPQARSCLLLL